MPETTTPTISVATRIAHSIDVGPTNNDQFEPQIVSMDDGRFVVLWTDNSDAAPGDTAGFDILAQIFDPFGNALGSVHRVNDGWFLDDESNFSVAALSDNKFVLVYEDADIDGVSIRATEVAVDVNNSLSFVNRNILADPGADTLADPTVSARSDGSYLVVYSKTSTGVSTDAFGKIVSNNGSVGAEFPVLLGSDDIGTERNDSATLSNGNYVTVHAHDFAAGDPGVFMRILDSNGASVLSATEVALTSGNGVFDSQPVVAALAQGGFVVVWANSDVDDTDVLFQIYNSSGVEVGGIVQVDNLGATDNNNEPAVVGLKDGGFIVVYDDDVADAIKAQRFDSTGAEVGATFTVAATAGVESSPVARLLDEGRVAIGWIVNNGANNDVKFAIYDPRNDAIEGTDDDDFMLARLGEDSTLRGLGGDDSLIGDIGSDLLFGGSGNDFLSSGAGADDLRGEDGNDTLSGGADNDVMRGFGGNDRLFGDDGDDTMFGHDGADVIEGRNGNDFLKGDAGNDWLRGGEGDDALQGGTGNDHLRGENGDDVLFGDDGADTLLGAVGVDEIRGGAGDDSLSGGDDGDKLFGWGENDLLEGDAGNDFMKGDNGDDTLDGGAGQDSLIGGAGNDVFRFSPDAATDFIGGFTPGAGPSDQIELVGYGPGFDSFAEVMAAASQVGTRVIIDFGGGDQLHLLTTNVASLTPDDFLFG
jgi:Ca2+-binding RTX toxin-like protein